MKNKLIPILLLIFTFVANAQIYDGTLVEDSKGRFIGDIKVLGIMNRATIDAVDKTGLLNEFTLKMKVWDYLGEPLEMYAFQWFRKESYRVRVDNTTRSIRLDQLKEYPDLQKRFLDLRPTKVDIKISGSASKISVEESSVPINVNYTYIIKDADLLIAKEGAFREPTVAGSPPTWNEFFDWQYPEPMGQLVNLNVSEASFKRLSEEEQKQRIKKIKNIWKQVKQLNVNASIITLEWPEYEMIDIIKTYDRYKNKKKELSPQEILDAELAKVQPTTEYDRNDEWGELPELKKKLNIHIVEGVPEIIIDESLNGDVIYGGNQFFNKETNKRLNIIDNVHTRLLELIKRDYKNFEKPQHYRAVNAMNDRFLIFSVSIANDIFMFVYDLKIKKILFSDSQFKYYFTDHFKINEDGSSNSSFLYGLGTDVNFFDDPKFSSSKQLLKKYLKKGEKYFVLRSKIVRGQRFAFFDENLNFITELFVLYNGNQNLVKETKPTEAERVSHWRKYNN
jgi:hypothetical protein